MVDVNGLPTLWQTIQEAMRLNESIFIDIQRVPGGIVVALLVVLLAGFSESLGQSIILFINRVSPLRFMLALLLTAANHVLGYLLWTVIIWLVGAYAFGRSAPLIVLASAVGLAYAPQLLAFFELTPFFGNSFSILLSLWSMIAIVIAVRAGLELETWQAIVVSGVGWLLLQLWRRTIGRPVYALGRWLQRRAAGVPLDFTLADLPVLRRRRLGADTLVNWRQRMVQNELHATLRLLKREQPRG